MEEKTYTITIDASNGKTWVDFSYQVNDHINKEIITRCDAASFI